MLFHVYAVHSGEACPLYSRDETPKVLEAFERLEPLAGELGVKIHYLTLSGPSHEFFFLLEAGSLSAISRLMFSIPIRQEVKIIPVDFLDEAISMAKTVAAARK